MASLTAEQKRTKAASRTFLVNRGVPNALCKACRARFTANRGGFCKKCLNGGGR